MVRHLVQLYSVNSVCCHMGVYKSFFCVFFKMFLRFFSYRACLIFVILLLAASHAKAASSFEPAFKTLGIFNEKTKQRIDLNIWYPTYSRPTPTNYNPWTLTVVPYGRAATGRFPAIILSHDSAATRFSYHESAAALARSGFVVIAPQHKEDNQDAISHMFSVEQWLYRIDDIRFALDTVLTHTAIKDSIDETRLGMVGFGTGGTIALLLGGATPDAEGWEHFCEQAHPSSPYCNTWGKGRMQKMVEQFPLSQSMTDPRLKAVVAVAPHYTMFFSAAALQNFVLPILLIEAGADSLNQAPWNAGALAKNFPQNIPFESLDNVDSFDLMSACPPALQRDLPELCGTAATPLRQRTRTHLNTLMQHFFLHHLGAVSK